MSDMQQDNLELLAELASDPTEQLGALTSTDQEATVTRLMPWGFSLLLHTGLVLLALFVVWSTVILTSDEQIIIPTARLSATPGAPLQLKQTERLKTDPLARRTVSPIRKQAPIQMQTNPISDASLVGVLGASGEANPFEAALAGGGELRAQFLGSGGNARRIAFVIDASGSIVGEFPFVIRELQRSVNQLSSRQYFTVIFYQGNDVKEVPPMGIDAKRATITMKEAVNRWLSPDQNNIELGGSSNPVRALRRAFSYEPQLIFLLSDAITGQGQYEIDQRKLLDEIDRINRAGTKINTLQFLQEDPLVKAGLKSTMEQIATRSGGVYTFVSEKDLNID